MKKLLFNSLGIAVIFLFVLSLLSVELVSDVQEPHPYCETITGSNDIVCWGRPTNCFCEYIVTPTK